MLRTDVHRPSVINAADYEFVGVEFSPGANDGDIGEIMMLQEERKRIRRHIEQTGGDYSRHTHGGNCHVCGAHCIYTVLWYHPKSNTYIRTGFDCADKIYDGEPDAFRPVRQKIEELKGEVRTARENRAGKNKASLMLEDAGLARAWEIYTANESELIAIEAVSTRAIAACECYRQWKPETVGATCEHCGQVRQRQEWTEPTAELVKLKNVIGTLVKYGTISEKQVAFLRCLVDTIDNRTQREAERKAKQDAERAAAADCPTGRVTISGTPLSFKQVWSQYGTQVKWLVRDQSGFKVFGTVPREIYESLADRSLIHWYEDNDRRGRLKDGVAVAVEFTAKVEPSSDDSKFGFYNRPTKARIDIDTPADNGDDGHADTYRHARALDACR